MKKWIIAFLLLTALGVGGVAVWRYVVPMRQVSDIYRRYEHVDGIAASYIHNYPVNDTITLFVTLLEATTDSGWALLVRDFEMDELSPMLQMLIERGENLVFSKLIPKSRPSASAENDVLAYSYTTRTACIFHISNDEEKHAVLFHNLDKSTNRDNKNIIQYENKQKNHPAGGVIRAVPHFTRPAFRMGKNHRWLRPKSE